MSSDYSTFPIGLRIDYSYPPSSGTRSVGSWGVRRGAMGGPADRYKKGTDVGMGVAQSQRPPNVGPRIWGRAGLIWPERERSDR
ncbi:hypothetical protein IWX62_001475 [Arthrobacter sp. CAN_A1]